MKIKSRIKLIFLLSFALIGLWSVKCFATSISVSPSTKNVAPGSTFNVTITGSDATGRVNISASNGTVSQTSAWIENNSVTVTVTAGNSGTVTVSANGELSSNSGVDQTVSGSTSVAIQSTSSNGGGTTTTSPQSNPSSTPTPSTTPTVDTNVNLSNLGIRPHDFSGFRAANTTYTVNVPNDCTSVEVYASAQSANAKISGTGVQTLKEGTNAFTVTVTNGDNTKSYRINVIRATSEGDIPPNVIDEEIPEEQEENSGIGLASLQVAGYQLDKEFKTDIYEYTITTKEKITLEDLEEIKQKIIAKVNNDRTTVDIKTEMIEDGIGKITIIIKDEEKEYAEYVIRVEMDKKEESPAILLTNVSNDSGNTGAFRITFENRVKLIVIGYVLTLLLAVYFAVKYYLRDRKLAEYEEANMEETTEFKKIDKFYKDVPENEDNDNADILISDEFKDNEKQELTTAMAITTDEENKNTVDEVASSLKKLTGYRNLRNTNKSTGRHF